MYTLDEVFDQALDDRFAGNVDGRGFQARINNGTKISKDTYRRPVFAALQLRRGPARQRRDLRYATTSSAASGLGGGQSNRSRNFMKATFVFIKFHKRKNWK